jgi:hypothetical protein
MGWDSKSAVWFVMTIGGPGYWLGYDHWQRYGAYDDDEAKIIIKYQYLCFFGMVLSGLASMAVVKGYVILTH